VRAVAVACLLAVVSSLGACSLYFGPGSGSGGDDGTVDAQPPPLPDAPRPPPPPDAPPATRYVAYCGGGGGPYRTEGPPSDAMYPRGDASGTCPGGCRTDSTYTSCGTDASCAGAEWGLCATPQVCPEVGQACQGEGTVNLCVEEVACGLTASVRDCSCHNGAYECRPACTPDQSICGPAGVAD